MNGRFLLVGTLVTAITLFAWQSISNTIIPWHTATMREFANNDAVVQAVRANAPENGVYFSPQGILASVKLTPNLIDRTTLIGQMLGTQIVIDLAVAFLLALVALRLRPTTTVGTAVALGTAGLAGSVLIELSNWNWYGFSLSWTTVNVVDHTIQWFLAGLVLAALMRRLAPASATSGVNVPAGAGMGQGERTVSKR
jgi:hypothetical protein